MNECMNIFGLIGFPLGHSFSPFIHNTIYKHLNINAAYTLFEVEKSNLHNAVNSMRILNIKGANITIPYKEEVLSCLDTISDDALCIGAVNTIENDHGHLKGYNTDYAGFTKSLEINKIDISNKDIMVIGAGGAARPVALSLLKSGSNVHLFGRDLQKVRSFESSFKSKYNSIFSYDLKNISEMVRLLKPYMVVNCTPLGMKGYDDSMIFKDLDIKGNVEVFYDLVYNPQVTRFQSLGKSCGCKIISGIDMLLLQAFESIKIWTGYTVDYDYGKKLLYKEGFNLNM